jgi:hypothetical protein
MVSPRMLEAAGTSIIKEDRTVHESFYD